MSHCDNCKHVAISAELSGRPEKKKRNCHSTSNTRELFRLSTTKWLIVYTSEKSSGMDILSIHAAENESQDDAVTANLLQEIDMLALNALDLPKENTSDDSSLHTSVTEFAVNCSSITAITSNIIAEKCGQSFQTTLKPESFLWDNDMSVGGDFPDDTTAPLCATDLPCTDFDLLSYAAADSQSDWLGLQQLNKSLKPFDSPEFVTTASTSFQSPEPTLSSSSGLDLVSLMSSSANSFTQAAHFTRIKPRVMKNCAQQQLPRREIDCNHDDCESAAALQTLLYKQPRRDVGEPKRPKNGFIRYSIKHRAELLKSYPFKDNRFISKLLGIRWKKMSAEEKQPYVEEFNNDIHEIRSHNPRWRYAPAKQSTEELIDPMNKRLRPRNKIRSKDTSCDWGITTDSSHHHTCEGCHSPLQKKLAMWKQCNICRQWRPLPGHVD